MNVEIPSHPLGATVVALVGATVPRNYSLITIAEIEELLGAVPGLSIPRKLVDEVINLLDRNMAVVKIDTRVVATRVLDPYLVACLEHAGADADPVIPTIQALWSRSPEPVIGTGSN